MKQPKKIKQPDLRKRLNAVRGAPEPDVSFTVTLPAPVYRAIEAVADTHVPEWVALMLTEAVKAEPLDDDGVGEE